MNGVEAGGVIGDAPGGITITSVAVVGSIAGPLNSVLGGIAGGLGWSSWITDATFAGDVTNSCCGIASGGIVGSGPDALEESLFLKRVGAEADISGVGGVGGIVGKVVAGWECDQCSFRGTVTAQPSMQSWIGGIVGEATSGALGRIIDSAVYGTIDNKIPDGLTNRAGGLAGHATSLEVSRAVSAAEVTAMSANAYVGGLAGTGGGSFSDAYFLKITGGINGTLSLVGSGAPTLTNAVEKSQSQLKDINTFGTFSICELPSVCSGEIWGVDSGVDYPLLRWMP